MKGKFKKRLQFTKSTVSNLSDERMSGIFGGATETYTCTGASDECTITDIGLATQICGQTFVCGGGGSGSMSLPYCDAMD